MKVSRSTTWLFSDLNVGDWFILPNDLDRFRTGKSRAWDPNDAITVYSKVGERSATSLQILGYLQGAEKMSPDMRVIKVNAPEDGPYVNHDAERALRDLTTVGPAKPLGYCSVDLVERNCDVNEFLASLKGKGLNVFYARKGRRRHVIAYHRQALQELIDKHRHAFQGKCKDWPRVASKFARHQMEHSAPSHESPAMYYLIAKAYADWRVAKYERGDWD